MRLPKRRREAIKHTLKEWGIIDESSWNQENQSLDQRRRIREAFTQYEFWSQVDANLYLGFVPGSGDDNQGNLTQRDEENRTPREEFTAEDLRNVSVSELEELLKQIEEEYEERRSEREQEGRTRTHRVGIELGTFNCSDQWINNLSKGLKIFFSKRSYITYKQKNEEILNEMVEEMREAGVVEEVNNKQLLSIAPIHIVPKAGNQWRLVYDCRGINKGTKFGPSKFLSLSKVEYFLHKKEMAGSLDLKNAYWQIKLDKRTSFYFGFKLGKKFFKWNRMPFGWNGAPAVFNKAMQRTFNLISNKEKVRFYFDDWLVAGSKDEVKGIYNVTKEELKRIGWVIREEKSEEPKEEIDYLGFTWDLKNKWIYPGSKSRKSFEKLSQDTKEEVLFGVWMYAAFAKTNGKIVLTKLRTMWSEIKNKNEVIRKINTWLRRGRRMIEPKRKWQVAYTDATPVGWGFWLPFVEGAGIFRREVKRIAIAELLAVTKILPLIRNQNLVLFLDNQNVVQWLRNKTFRKSSGRPLDIRFKVINYILKVCYIQNINLIPKWIPSAENKADLNSRKNEIFIKFY